MKNKKILLSLLIVAFLWNCEAKPEEDKFGLSPDAYNVAVLGVISNTAMIDTGTGTIKDIRANLEWKKCSHGQVFRATQNDCLGAATGSTFTPQDSIRVGAAPVSFCDSKTHACNRVAVPQILVATSQIAVLGSSEAFSACNLGEGYRVPNPYELERLAVGGRNGLLARFPNTVESDYWSEWSDPTDLIGETAFTVSFDRQTFGQQNKILKTEKNYLRCVRIIP